MDIDVVVLAGGRVIDSIRRPVRDLLGAPAVTYRRRLWPLKDGTIEILGTPDLEGSACTPAGEGVVDLGAQDRGTGTKASTRPETSLASHADPVTAPKLTPAHSTTVAPEPTQVNRQDDEQDSVIQAPCSSRILVQAGPGSGKTEVTARRIAKLIDSGVAPSQILVLSFSRSAVATLTRRLEQVGEQHQRIEDLQHVAIRTFDAWAFRLLRLAGEQPSVLLARSHEANIEAANALISGPRQSEVLQFLGEKRHVFVDEFQDLTGARASMAMSLLELYASPSDTNCGFTVLGDRAQAIYGFTAAQLGNTDAPDVWTRVERLYAGKIETIILRHNHRAAPNLSAFSRELRLILESELAPATKIGVVQSAVASLPHSGEIGPAWVQRQYKKTAILTRTNGEAVRIVQKLHGKEPGPPARPVILKLRSSSTLPPAWISILLYRAKSGTISRKKFATIHAFIQKEQNVLIPASEEAWVRLLHAAAQSTNDTFLDLQRLRTRLSWPDFDFEEEAFPKASILVTTIHQAKGMEFDEVHIVEVDAASMHSDQAMLEEASVTFVGITRARKELGRISPESIRPSITQHQFARGPARLLSWMYGWVNIEIGVQGDIASSSFVDAAVHGSNEAVYRVQALLADQDNQLLGKKVVLCKTRLDNGHYIYDIHLQNEANEPGEKLGQMTAQLTKALLELLWKRNFSLPAKIRNLRINGVGAMSASSELPASVPEPWNTSKLWLGISLAGTGDFRSYKRTVGQA